MNIRRHDSEELVRTYGVTFSQRELTPPCSADWNLLVYAIRGVVTAKTELGTWVVPPHRALWVPASIKTHLELGGVTALRMIYMRSRLPEETSEGRAFEPTTCAVFNVTPLLRELILKAIAIGALFSTEPQHCRIEGLMWDELESIPSVPLQLPYPQSEVAMSFVSRFETSITESINLSELILESGWSLRTIERYFQAETGMSLGQWIRRRKLLEGLKMLVAGTKVGDVAFQLGYNSPSSFIAMFKRELGTSPAAYLSSN